MANTEIEPGLMLDTRQSREAGHENCPHDPVAQPPEHPDQDYLRLSRHLYCLYQDIAGSLK